MSLNLSSFYWSAIGLGMVLRHIIGFQFLFDDHRCSLSFVKFEYSRFFGFSGGIHNLKPDNWDNLAGLYSNVYVNRRDWFLL